jgi:hypothetical protein
MEHHRELPPGGREGATSPREIDERAREYESFEEAERRRLERYSRHLTERERIERFPIG